MLVIVIDWVNVSCINYMCQVLNSTVLKIAVQKNMDVSTNWILQRLITKMKIIENKTNLVIQCHAI
jgi:hypothetical protein